MTSTYKIEYRAGAFTASPDGVEADYYKREDGWFVFKTADHKALFEVNADDVRSITRVSAAPAIQIQSLQPGSPATVNGREGYKVAGSTYTKSTGILTLELADPAK